MFQGKLFVGTFTEGETGTSRKVMLDDLTSLYNLSISNINLFLGNQSSKEIMEDLTRSEIHKIFNHPVHILDNSTKELSPSSFIPLCDFGGNFNNTGVKIDHFNIPVCNIFEAKIFNDQLCYEVDLNIFNSSFTQSTLKKGFTFYVDLNKDKQYPKTGSQSGDFMVYLNALGNI